MRARHRFTKLLLRHGIVCYGGKPWTANHDRWLGVQRRQAVFALPGQGLAFDTAYDTVLATLARRDRLDAAIAALAADSAFTPVAGRLGCLRGVSTLTAFGLAVEIGDWHRLTGRSIGALVRAENPVTVSEQHVPGGRPRHHHPDESQHDRQPSPSDSSTRCSFAC